MPDIQDIKLTPEQQTNLARISEAFGKPWPEILAEALAEYQTTHNGSGEKKTSFGAGRSVVVLAEDFDAPLADFKEYTE